MNIYLKYIVVGLFTCISLYAYPQQKTLSLNDSLNIDKAMWKQNRALILGLKELNDSSSIYLEQAKSTFEKYKDWEQYLISMHYEGYLFGHFNEHDKSIMTYHKAVNLAVSKLDKSNPLIPRLYNKLGGAYTNILNYKKAENYYLQGLNYLDYVGDDRQFTYLYGNLSGVYHNLGNFDKAIDYEEKAFVYSKKIGEDKFYPEVLHLQTKAELFVEKKQYEKAKKLFEKILKDHFSDESNSEFIFNKLECYYFLSMAERRTANYDKAMNHINTALQLFNKYKSSSEFKLNAKRLYMEKSRIYSDQEKYLLSHKNILLALQYIDKSKRGSNIYKELGDSYLALNELDSALTQFQIGINMLNPRYKTENIFEDPDLNITRNKVALIDFLIGKSEVFYRKFRSGKDKKWLRAAYKLNLKTFHLIDLIFRDLQSSDAKLDWSNYLLSFYEMSIEVALLMYEIEKDETYRFKAFEFAEKSKGTTLLAGIQTTNAKQFSAIPDSLLGKERDIKSEYSFYQTQLQQQLVKQNGFDTLLVNKSQEKLFALNRERENLELLLEKEYPKYFNLKYNNVQVSVSDVQSILDKKTTLLEYFVGDKAIYVFLINKNTYKVKKLSAIENLTSQVLLLPKYLKDDNKEGYAKIAHNYFNTLIKPLEKNIGTEGVANLIVIPDAALWQLNFDILLSVKPEQLDYRRFEYLIKKYNVGYAYSAKLLVEGNGLMLKPTPPKNECLAFSYNNKKPEDISSGNYLDMEGFRNAKLSDLPGTRKEIKAVSSVVDGAYYFGTFASESNFKEKAKDYSILHLALHGVIDDENPMNSKLYFTQDNDSIEDNYLHAYELYNIELNADLAVLSACNTGSGKIVRGEGIMSLGRAFTYAGCKSLLLSQWELSDAFTPDLMKDFYQNLKDGKQKAQALRDAKLKYLSLADNQTANPYYWAALVQLGNNSPLKQNNSYWVWVSSAMGLLLIVGSVYFIKSNKLKG